MSPNRRIPLDSLRTFEAAARHGSFVKAGEELNVTPAAISHRVKDLEASLGVSLFTRRPRGVLLTDAGRRYRDNIAEAFRVIDRATATVDQVSVAGPLMVSMPESIAEFWLVPRLHRLGEYAPGLELSIEADNRIATLNDGGADIAIRFGSGNYPEFESELLFGDAVTIVAPASAASEPADARARAVVESAVLLTDYGATEAEPWMHWSPWLRELGLAPEDCAGVVRMSNSALAIRACAAEVGVCLGRLSLVMDLLTERRLQPLLPWRSTETAHYLVMPPAAIHNPRVQAFRRWLLEEIGAFAETARKRTGFELST
jgi:LysR family glycine cleavage system transcriptional activator